MAGRGRPKSQATIEVERGEPPRQYTRSYTDEDDVITTWSYDLDISNRGPISVEQFFPKGFLTPVEKQHKRNSKLPRSKQTFYNPENGKLVGYARASQLGLLNIYEF